MMKLFEKMSFFELSNNETGLLGSTKLAALYFLFIPLVYTCQRFPSREKHRFFQLTLPFFSKNLAYKIEAIEGCTFEIWKIFESSNFITKIETDMKNYFSSTKNPS